MQTSSNTISSSAVSLLKINGLNLIMPQSDIRSLELATDIDFTAPALCSAGWVAYSSKHWPVYCLSDELALMENVPAERHACAVLPFGAVYIGVLCDDMIMLKQPIMPPQALPPSMKLAETVTRPGTPIQHLVLYEHGIACLSNAQYVSHYIEQLVFKTGTTGKAPDVRP